MHVRKWLFIAAALVAVALATGCGGSGDDPEPAELTGIVTATAPNPLPEAVIVGAVSPQPEGFRYTVEAGDSPASLAARFGITVDAIIEANDIVDPTALVIGQVLVIPGASDEVIEDVLPATVAPTATAEPVATQPPTAIEAPTPEPGELTIYIVQEGDIPETIAAQFGITADELMAANGITDPASLQIGQELIIPSPQSTPEG